LFANIAYGPSTPNFQAQPMPYGAFTLELTMLNQTFLSSLVALIGARKGNPMQQQAAKVATHAAILETTALVLALHLCARPPKGKGDAGDHAKLRATFAHAGMDKHAAQCAAIKQALSLVKGRSIADWEDAIVEGYAIASSAFDALAPKTYSASDLKARTAKREEGKAKRLAEAKAAEVQAKADADKVVHAARAQAFAEGQKAAPMTAQMVADAIRASGFDAEGVALIRAACESVMVPALTA